MPWLTMDFLLTSGMVPGVDPGPLGPMLQQELARYLHWVDTDMDGREFAAGDSFTAADVMLAYALEFAKGRGHLADTQAPAALSRADDRAPRLSAREGEGGLIRTRARAMRSRAPTSRSRASRAARASPPTRP